MLKAKVALVMMIAIVMSGCEVSINSEYNPSVEYCSMWKVWHESGGEYGYPDPNNVYERECVEDE